MCKENGRRNLELLIKLQDRTTSGCCASNCFRLFLCCGCGFSLKRMAFLMIMYMFQTLFNFDFFIDIFQSSEILRGSGCSVSVQVTQPLFCRKNIFFPYLLNNSFPCYASLVSLFFLTFTQGDSFVNSILNGVLKPSV